MGHDDCVVVVTGGTRGIGRGIAEAYLADGATVVVCGRHEPDRPVEHGGAQAHFVAADVRDPEQFAAVLDVADGLGGVDVLVANAGGTPAADPLTASPRFHAAIVELNLTAPMQCAFATFARLRGRDATGSIVFISSVAALIPDPAAPSYSAAKAGLSHLTRALAGTFAPHVRVNAVTAGLIETERAGTYPPEAAAGVPAGRLGAPADVAEVCLLLTDPGRTPFLTGAEVACHGGRAMPWFDAPHPDGGR
jgi:NAD(P)-dependent dehydrogenase (short-subunit alcohol dehydrogenase family)